MSVLTGIGLIFDMFGAVILLGPEYRPIEKAAKRVDPLYYLVNSGIETLKENAWNDLSVDPGEPIDLSRVESMPAYRREFLFTKWFINRRHKNKIHPTDELFIIDTDGGVQMEDMSDSETIPHDAIFRNGKPLSFDEARQIPHPEGGAVITEFITVGVIERLIETAQRKRMYRVGVGLLVFGFFLQLLAQWL